MTWIRIPWDGKLDPLQQDEQTLVLAKPMQDGSWAVGLFNLSETEREIAVDFTDLGLERPQRVRDLWRQVDLPPEASDYRSAWRHTTSLWCGSGRRKTDRPMDGHATERRRRSV